MSNTSTDSRYKLLGFVLVCAGLAGFAANAILSYTPMAVYDNGALPAASSFMVMIGFAFCYPSMLEENTGALSTMRMVVFATVLVFCVVYIKMAWTTATFSNFTIDKSWIYILGLAFGSKAVQKFGEQSEDPASGNTNGNTGSTGGNNSGGAGGNNSGNA